MFFIEKFIFKDSLFSQDGRTRSRERNLNSLEFHLPSKILFSRTLEIYFTGMGLQYWLHFNFQVHSGIFLQLGCIICEGRDEDAVRACEWAVNWAISGGVATFIASHSFWEEGKDFRILARVKMYLKIREIPGRSAAEWRSIAAISWEKKGVECN